MESTFFTFNVQVDSNPEILRVRASIRVLTAEEGGRTMPVFSGYRPDHNFGGPENRLMYMGVIEFDGEPNEPGKTKEVEIRFLSGLGLRELLCRGRKQRIQEGNILVAQGEIIEVDL